MRRILISLTVIALLIVPQFAAAGDVDDLKAAVLAVDAAFADGDVKKILKYMHPESSRFPADGGLLRPTANEAELKAWYGTGIKFSSQARHIGIKIYDNTGVVTYYTVEETTQPDGKTTQSTIRSTEIWIKKGSNWKRVHIHSSPLTPVQE